MKPKYRRFLRAALPSLIILPAMAQFASAAIFVDDTAGNAQPTAADNGENTIIANGGTSPAPFVTISDGVNLNGDVGQTAVLLLANSPYTVNIAGNGILAANSNQDGIGSTTAFTLNNLGTVSGFGTGQGIDSVGGTAINNSNLISGPDDAIRFSTAGGTVSNLIGGVIDGVTGLTSDGIQGIDTFTVNNNGTIRANNDGISSANGAIVNNLTNFNLGVPVSGGSITGANDGIQAGAGLTVQNQNLATITGTAGNGITAGNSASITNNLGATITGGIQGINAGAGLFLNNVGMITGQAGDGVLGGSGANITNSGTIRGNGLIGDAIQVNGNSSVINSGNLISNASHGIEVFAIGEETFTLTNSGFIFGNNAFDGANSDDTLNLNFGSFLSGNVTGLGGTDIINFNGGLISPDNSVFGPFSNSILGNVTGIETINKTGGGVAFIGGPGNGGFNVNADTITITGGGLYINGNIAGANVEQSTINAGGAALGGTGIWNANVNITGIGGFSAGAIPINLDANPVNSVGTVNLTGDVVHAPTTFIRYDFVPQGGATDAIVQTGVGNTYNIGGGFVRLSSTNNDQALRNGTYVVVQSDENIQGLAQFRPNVQYNANVADTGLRGNQAIIGGANNPNTVLGSRFSTITVVGNQILLNVNHDFSALATNPNAAAFGNALDASINRPAAQDFIAALDNSDLAFVQATLNGLSPDATFASSVALVSGNHRLNALVRDHLALTRAGGDTVSYNVGSYSAPAPAPQVQNAGIGNVWGSVSYAWKEIDSNFGNDFDGEDASFTAGVDYRVSQDFLIGLVLDGSTGDYDFTGGSSDVDSFRAAIYGTYGQPTGLYVDFLAGYGSHNIDQTRNGGGLLGNINSDTDADSLQAAITVGYAMQSGSVKHGPFGGFEYQKVEVDGYTQGGLFPVAVNGYDVDSFRLLGGYRVEADYGRFMPFASIAYAHEFEDDQLNTTAVIPGGAGFGVSGGGLDSAILISLGANYALTESLTLTGGYHGEIGVGGDGTDSHGASLGLNYAF